MFSAEAPTEDEIQEWLVNGDIEQLEKLVLDGRGHMLSEKQSDNNAVQDFLKALSQYQVKLDISTVLYLNSPRTNKICLYGTRVGGLSSPESVRRLLKYMDLDMEYIDVYFMYLLLYSYLYFWVALYVLFFL